MDIFNNNHFSSGDGMLTSIWGPSLWHFLHTMSFNYPVKPSKKQKICYNNFILNLQNILPCIHCRNNLPKNLKQAGFNYNCLKNRDNFSKFIYDLHNNVNKMLGKKNNISYKDVRNRYEHFRSRCLKKTRHKLKKIEDGCIDSLYGNKSKCIIKIVPKSCKKRTFSMDPKCKIKNFKHYKKSDKKSEKK